MNVSKGFSRCFAPAPLVLIALLVLGGLVAACTSTPSRDADVPGDADDDGGADADSSTDADVERDAEVQPDADTRTDAGDADEGDADEGDADEGDADSPVSPRSYPWRLTMCPRAVVVPATDPRTLRPDFGELATDPAAWDEVLSVTDTFKFYVGTFWTPDLYPEASQMADLIRDRDLRVTIEVGGLRVYGTGPETCDAFIDWLGPHTAEVEAGWIENWVDAGGTVNTLAMDHPLHFLRRASTPCGASGIAVSDLIVQLGAYMEEMTRLLDAMGVGPVEFALIDTSLGYDVTGLDGHEYHSTDTNLFIGSFHDTLAALAAEADRRGVQFTSYEADHGIEGAETDYSIRYGTPLPRTVSECETVVSSDLELGRLLAVERIVHDLGLDFGVVVNANHQCHRAVDDLYSDYPWGADAAALSVADRTMTYLTALLDDLPEAPDQLLFQTWFRYPETTLPETDPESYLGLARALFLRAVPERAEVGFFRVFNTIFQVSAAAPDDYCAFASWDDYLAAGGDPTLAGVTSYAAQPTDQHFTGGCP